jgi:hypothetical protein
VAYGVIAAAFVYTTITNIVERPEGVKIASCFIAGILVVSFLSRVVRAFELRVTAVHLDEAAQRFIEELAPGPIKIIANEPDEGDEAEYREKLAQVAADHHLPDPHQVLFLEVSITDPSDFESELYMRGVEVHGYRALRAASPSVPNAIAALLLHIRDITGRPPHIYFEWTEGNPILHLLRYLFFGVGEVAPVTREILREAEPEPRRRPVVHVG